MVLGFFCLTLVDVGGVQLVSIHSFALILHVPTLSNARTVGFHIESDLDLIVT